MVGYFVWRVVFLIPDISGLKHDVIHRCPTFVCARSFERPFHSVTMLKPNIGIILYHGGATITITVHIFCYNVCTVTQNEYFCRKHRGGGRYACPSEVFVRLHKKSSDDPYLKLLTFQHFLLRMPL